MSELNSPRLKRMNCSVSCRTCSMWRAQFCALEDHLDFLKQAVYHGQSSLMASFCRSWSRSDKPRTQTRTMYYVHVIYMPTLTPLHPTQCRDMPYMECLRKSFRSFDHGTLAIGSNWRRCQLGPVHASALKPITLRSVCSGGGAKQCGCHF